MRLFLRVIFLFLSFNCLSQTGNTYNLMEINIKEVLPIDDLLYFKKDTTLITGRVVRYNKKGKIKKVLYVAAGKPDKIGWMKHNNINSSPSRHNSDDWLELLGTVSKGVLQAVDSNNKNP